MVSVVCNVVPSLTLPLFSVYSHVVWMGLALGLFPSYGGGGPELVQT